MDEEIKIREYREKDLLDLLKIESKIFGEKAFSIEVFSELIYKSDILYVAEKKGIIGYILANNKEEKTKLNSLGMIQSHRKKGIGSKLLKKTEKEAIENKSKEIVLEVRETNIEAFSFYKQHGFQEKKVIENYYRDGENAIKMKKKLSYPEK